MYTRSRLNSKRFILPLGILLITLFSISAFARSGRVIDRVSGQPIANATITFGELKILADAQGKFEIPETAADVTCTVSHVGYLSRSISINNDSELIIALDQTEQQLDDILVTAQRTDRTVARTPKTTYRTSSTDIDKSGAQTATDAIRTLPGVAMTDAGTFRARPVLRGLYGSRLLVLVDGERQNDLREVSDFAGVSLSLVDVNEIDRVEVVSGSTSPLYGSDAMGGVINVITNRAGYSSELRPMGTYSGRYSSTDEQQSHRLEFGVQSPDWYLSGAGSWRETGRNYRPPTGWQNESGYEIFNSAAYDKIRTRTGKDYADFGLVNTGAEIKNADLRLGARLSTTSRLEADLGMYEAGNIGYPGVPNDSTPFFFSYPQHDRRNGSLSYVNDKIGGAFGRFESKLYVQQVEKEFFTDFLGSLRIPTGPGGPTIVPLTASSRTEVTKVGLNIQQEQGSNDGGFHATYGIEGWTEKYHGNVKEVTLLDFSFPGPPDMTTTEFRASVPESRWNSAGIFTRSNFDLGIVTIEAGARADFFSVKTTPTSGYVDDDDLLLPGADDKYSSLTGSLGAMLPVSEGVSVYSTIGTAYRVPNTVERFFYGSASGRNVRPNADIKPERSYSLETGFKGVQPSFSYALIGFYNSYDNFVQLRSIGSNLWQYQNVQDATIYGGEMLIEGRLQIGFYGDLGISYQHGDTKADGDKQPLFVAPFTATLSLGWRESQRSTYFELSSRLLADQDRVSNSTALDDVATKGFAVFNLSGGIRLFEQVHASVAVNNLFDELYSEPFNARGPDNPIPESGRNFVFSLKADVF